MNAYGRCTNVGKNLTDSVPIYSRDRKTFRPPTYIPTKDKRTKKFNENIVDTALQLSDELGEPVHYNENFGLKMVHRTAAERQNVISKFTPQAGSYVCW
jgi:hypothetical protein